MTVGTLFGPRRSPLTARFVACWMIATQKDAIPALALQRVLDIGAGKLA